MHLEPGCIVFIAQWIKTKQEDMVLTPNQVKLINFVCTQIMQNGSYATSWSLQLLSQLD